jgi:hypothetical protein
MSSEGSESFIMRHTAGRGKGNVSGHLPIQIFALGLNRGGRTGDKGRDMHNY